MLTAVRAMLKAPFLALLAWPPFRRRALFELRRRYYRELANVIPLGHTLECPLAFPEAWSSFAEIFVHREYAAAFDRLPLPGRWLDLGCHAGFFSLYVAWRRALAGEADLGKALLVDADSRMAAAVGELVERNRLADRFVFVHGAIGRGTGDQPFRERGFMSSSAAASGAPNGTLKDVPVLTPDGLLALLPSPYDLVKVDIEGGEYDFVTSYDPVLRVTRAVLVEWHSGDEDGRGEAYIRCELERRGFGTAQPLSSSYRDASGAHATDTGLLLFVRP